MNKVIPIMIAFLFFPAFSFGQDVSKELTEISKAFYSFQYKNVIFKADSILSGKNNITVSDKVEIYRFKAISHFSLRQVKYSEISFMALLDLNPEYVLNKSENAPKIVQLFSRLKTRHKSKQVLKPTKKDSILAEMPRQIEQANLKNVSGALLRSLLIPGWGHSYLDKPGTKWFLSGSAILLSSVAYFTYTSLNYEKKYLNETDLAKITGRFKTFNSHYQARNIVLAAYISFWAYTQYDLFSSIGPTSQPFLSLHISRQPVMQISIPF